MSAVAECVEDVVIKLKQFKVIRVIVAVATIASSSPELACGIVQVVPGGVVGGDVCSLASVLLPGYNRIYVN